MLSLFLLISTVNTLSTQARSSFAGLMGYICWFNLQILWWIPLNGIPVTLDGVTSRSPAWKLQWCFRLRLKALQTDYKRTTFGEAWRLRLGESKTPCPISTSLLSWWVEFFGGIENKAHNKTVLTGWPPQVIFAWTGSMVFFQTRGTMLPPRSRQSWYSGATILLYQQDWKFRGGLLRITEETMTRLLSVSGNCSIPLATRSQDCLLEGGSRQTPV